MPEGASVLRRAAERNPRLIEAAFDLHRDGAVPANSWLIDLDAVADNATVLSSRAEAMGLRTYLMTKQFNRNPFVAAVAMSRGLGPAVAVDAHCARVLHRFGVRVGHVGHLNQIPPRWLDLVLAMEPEVVTVYTVEMAERVSAAARRAARVQPVLLRVWARGDSLFAGQEGGFEEVEVAAAAARIEALEGVSVAGVTAFPCVHYNFGEGHPSAPRLTPNAHTVSRSSAVLADVLGRPVEQINMPGNTSSETMALLAGAGATHVEPGHGLLGTTANHLFGTSLPEIPAYTYVSEVSHDFDGRVYAFGGGLWRQGPSSISGEGPLKAFVGSADCSPAEVLPIEQIIDYHMVIDTTAPAHVGATVVSSFYSQMQMTRAYVVPVSGVSTGRARVEGVFDWATNMLDERYQPVRCDVVADRANELAERYRAASPSRPAEG